MSSPQQRIQVLYELSLAIGSEGTLDETARTALSAYLRKLNCAAGAVFERQTRRDGGVTYEAVTKIPSRAAIDDTLETAINRLSAEAESLPAALPITAETEGGDRYYIMSLPNFGVIILVTRAAPLDAETVAALGQLNEKLATACRGERYEDRLRAERDRFETIFATIDQPLVTARPEDGQLLIQRINPAFETTFGHDERIALGRSVQSLLGTARTGDDELPPLGEASQSVRTKLRWETADGVNEFLVRATPLNPDGDEMEYLLLFVDVTEAVTRRRRLERFHDVTKALARILRHNIRNDLTVIQAMAERIRDGTDGAQAESAATILRKSEQLASTAAKAREMRNLVATYDRKPAVAVRTALSDAVNSVRRDYPDSDITLRLTTPDDARVAPSIGIAVEHLVENGVEHHEGDGTPRVVVVGESGDDGLRITVRDNASGIPEAEVAALEQTSETQLSHGAGAGLWIIGQIIDHCDATLEFLTDDDGTTATITVPR